jgi:hypothetical protein
MSSSLLMLPIVGLMRQLSKVFGCLVELLLGLGTGYVNQKLLPNIFGSLCSAAAAAALAMLLPGSPPAPAVRGRDWQQQASTGRCCK